MWTKEWAVNTFNAAFLAFAGAFVGAISLAGAGAFGLPGLRAAAIAGGAAAVVAVQAALAQLVPGKNPTASLPRALTAKLRAPGPPAPAALTREDLIAALQTVLHGIPAAEPPPPRPSQQEATP